MSGQLLQGSLMGDFQKQLTAKLLARHAQQATVERPNTSSSPPPPPPPFVKPNAAAAAPPPPPPPSVKPNADTAFPPPPPPFGKHSAAVPAFDAPFPPPPPPLIAKADDSHLPPLSSDVEATDSDSSASASIGPELRERHTTRYQNPGWQSNSSRSRLPAFPENSHQPECDINSPMQFKLQLEQQLQQQRGNPKLPPPLSAKGTDHSPTKTEIPMHTSNWNNANEDFLQEIMGPNARVLQPEWSKPGEQKVMYRRLHEYVHGVPIGEVLMLNEIDRAMALEQKFNEMREIFLSVEFIVDW